MTATPRFTQGQLIKVMSGELKGLTGRVERLRMADHGAWVKMDADLPKALQNFEPNDSRFRHALLYPEDCEAL